MDLKIRLFALAKELGIDSKDLIEHCNSAGIKVKNSPLASISPEERDLVLGHLKKSGPIVATAPPEEAQMTPFARESARDAGGKIRSIKPVVSRPSLARERPAPVVETELPVEHEEPPAPVEEAPAVEESLPQEAAASAAPAVEPPAPPSEGTAPPARGALRRPGAAGEKPAESGPEPPRPSPAIRPEEYVPPGGVRNSSSIREMKPRGTITESEQAQQRRPKPKAKPALPNVAAPPTYKGPTLRGTPKAEAPAQKPDIPLSPDTFTGNSPLRAHLKKNVEQKKKRKKGEGEGGTLEAASSTAFIGEDEDRDRKATTAVRDRRENWKRSSQDSSEATERKRRAVRFRQRRAEPVALKTAAELSSPITVRSLSEALGRPARDLLRMLMDRGEAATINATLTEETAMELAMELGVELSVRRAKDVEQELAQTMEVTDAPEELVERPPIVTILGHVDHGKTTLLDKIRTANVAAGEAGGITQHIAAYQVEHAGKKITFVDTPGHAAFSEMRARGANLTDFVVLVVAADDGVMPQTIESISHARSAKVPMVVAMNKIDLPSRNEQRVLQDLAAHEVLATEWGGDTDVIRTSATTGKGIDELLETIQVGAELRELKANPKRPAVGVCLEAFRDEGRGVIAWLVVQNGTLHVGDVILCGEADGRIRALYDDHDRPLEAAGPSTPVKVAGLDSMPGAGDRFWVMSDIEQAREVATGRRQRGRAATLSGRGRPRSLEDILTAAREGSVQDLPLIIKADSQGSIEALRSEIGKFSHAEVRVTIVHEGVGGVNESDVALAEASGAIVIAFHVVPEERARAMAERDGVDIRRFEIIYEVIDTIKRSLEGLLPPERKQVMTGRAFVMKTFQISRLGTIAGCRVLSGTIERSNRINVIRDQTILNSYDIASLKRVKDDAREVREGMECGIRLDGFNDIKEGDILESYRVDEIKRTLD
ncbi:MAG TPA: translation initiation factor IF-2 [Planctomycetaceae bacterium]|jgi:translation initiation factor IF-2|nr:translation initiation factor IF-2 [Planctomycetaceae bacterium]